jgi:hypothetical protein
LDEIFNYSSEIAYLDADTTLIDVIGFFCLINGFETTLTDQETGKKMDPSIPNSLITYTPIMIYNTISNMYKLQNLFAYIFQFDSELLLIAC